MQGPTPIPRTDKYLFAYSLHEVDRATTDNNCTPLIQAAANYAPGIRTPIVVRYAWFCTVCTVCTVGVLYKTAQHVQYWTACSNTYSFNNPNFIGMWPAYSNTFSCTNLRISRFTQYLGTISWGVAGANRHDPIANKFVDHVYVFLKLV